jgi:hypothetical protein
MSLTRRIRTWWFGLRAYAQAWPEPDPCCRRGHPLTPANAYTRPDGRGTECRTCRRNASQRRRHATSNKPTNGHSQEG